MITFSQNLHNLRIARWKEWMYKEFNLRYNRSNIYSVLSKEGRLPSEEYITLIKDAWELLEQIYPGRGDIQFEFEPVYKYHINTYGSNIENEFRLFERSRVSKIFIMIHFPEINISNSSGGEHTIKNLYVRIPITARYNTEVPHSTRRGRPVRGRNNITSMDTTPLFEGIEGTRSTVSIAELQSDYVHSHLPGVNMSRGLDMRFNNFCTGVGDINNSTALLNSEYSKEHLELLLLQVDPFVRWESLEGTPHRRMSRIAAKDYTIPEITGDMCESMYRELVSRYYIYNTLDLNWRFQNGRYEIIDDDLLEEYFRLYLPYYITSHTYFVHRDERGEYYVGSRFQESVLKESENWIPFRGNKVRFIAEGEYKPKSNISYIHPQIKDYVKKQFEQLANKAKAREASLIK